MSKKENNKSQDDSLSNTSPVISHEVPPGVDRRSFLMRSAVVGAAAVMTGTTVSARSRTLKAFSESLPEQTQGPAPPLSADLAVASQTTVTVGGLAGPLVGRAWRRRRAG